MIGIIALASLVYFLLPFYLFSRINRLSKEVEILKSKFGNGAVVPTQHTQSLYTPPIQAVPAQQVQNEQNIPPIQRQFVSAETVPTTTTPIYQKEGDGAFSAWIKEDFFVKLGALLLLIGFGWFVSYAFIHQWIGPVGRITLGVLAGVAIMVLGTWRIRSFVHQGSIFLVLGSSTVLLTIFAAREIYDFFTPTTALGVMFISVAFVAYVSVVYKNQNLALASLILASIAPFFTSAPTPDIAGLFTYLLLVVLGTLWVVYLTGSHTLTFCALIIVMVYGAPFATGSLGEGERDIALLFAFIFTSIFFVANIISMLRHQGTDVLQAHLAIAFGTGIYLILWIMAAAPEEFQSLLFSAWMLVFALGSFVVYKHSLNRAPFYIYSAISVGLLAAATAAELEGPLLTIAFTVETGLIVLLARLLTGDVRIVQKVSVLFIVPVALSLTSIISHSWSYGFLHGDFFVLVILALAFLAVSMSLLKRNELGQESSMELALFFGVAGVTYILIIIWLVLHSLLTDDAATTISLVIYAIIGFSLFISGRMKEEKLTRVAGSILLGFVVAHLMLIDVWQMQLAGRIITFFAIGTLLISTAFIKPRATGEHMVADDTHS